VLFDAVEGFLAEPDTEVAAESELATAVVVRLASESERFHDALARVVARERGTLHMSGTRLLAVFDGPARAVSCAAALADMARHNDVKLAAAAHTALVARHVDGVRGSGVEVAVALDALAEDTQVLLTRTVVDLIAGSGINVEELGTFTTPGYNGTYFAVALPDG
jgi:class 3 adenylate cyclase